MKPGATFVLALSKLIAVFALEMRHLGNQISSNSSSDSAAGDSQGKTRQYAVQKRVALLLVAFIAGITFGIVIAERLYVEANREHLKPIEKGGLAVCAPSVWCLRQIWTVK